MKKITIALFSVVTALTFWACTQNMTETIPTRQLNLAVLNADYSDLITGFQNVLPTPSNITNAKINLGRVLFYDTRLSFNNTTSCGSCHKQQFAFADNASFSEGFKGVNALRNSMPLQNLFFQGERMFWDNRADSLGQLITMPIQDHIEMGFEKIENLPTKLAQTDYYANLFTQAYGTSTITVERINTAIRDFISILRSKSSRFEELRAATPNPNPGFPPSEGFFNIWDNTQTLGFTGLESLGQEIFLTKGRCASCHSSTRNLDGWEAANTGLELNYTDPGMGKHTPGWEGVFKTPGLRNIELTAPYMHDGRFKTLEQVVEFYNSGIQPHRNLHWTLRDFGSQDSLNINPGFGPEDDIFINPNGPVTPVKLGLTDLEKAGLVAFLKTLTDRKFVTDPRFSNPFMVN